VVLLLQQLVTATVTSEQITNCYDRFFTLLTLHNISTNNNNSYSAHLRDNRCEPGFFKQPRSKDVDVSVHVLTTGYWPAYPPNDVAVPAELADHMARFEDYYMAKYQVHAAAFCQQCIPYSVLASIADHVNSAMRFNLLYCKPTR
jgi:Cullin family